MSYLNIPRSNIYISAFPKCGCNFIRSFVYGIDSSQADNKWSLKVFSKNDISQANDPFVINVVRNPYSRFASAFCSKLVSPPPKKYCHEY